MPTDELTEAEAFADDQIVRAEKGKPVLLPETESEDLQSASTRGHTGASTFDPMQEASDRKDEDREYDVPDEPEDREGLEPVPLRPVEDEFDTIVVCVAGGRDVLEVLDEAVARAGDADAEDRLKVRKAQAKEVRALAVTDRDSFAPGATFAVVRVRKDRSLPEGEWIYSVIERGISEWPGEVAELQVDDGQPVKATPTIPDDDAS